MNRRKFLKKFRKTQDSDRAGMIESGLIRPDGLPPSRCAAGRDTTEAVTGAGNFLIDFETVFEFVVPGRLPGRVVPGSGTDGGKMTANGCLSGMVNTRFC